MIDHLSSGVGWTALMMRFAAQAKHSSDNPELSGHFLGTALRIAHDIVEHGASPADVRELLALALSGAKPRPRARVRRVR